MGTPAEWEVHAALTKMCQTRRKDFLESGTPVISWSRR